MHSNENYPFVTFNCRWNIPFGCIEMTYYRRCCLLLIIIIIILSCRASCLIWASWHVTSYHTSAKRISEKFGNNFEPILNDIKINSWPFWTPVIDSTQPRCGMRPVYLPRCLSNPEHISTTTVCLPATLFIQSRTYNNNNNSLSTCYAVYPVFHIGQQQLQSGFTRFKTSAVGQLYRKISMVYGTN